MPLQMLKVPSMTSPLSEVLQIDFAKSKTVKMSIEEQAIAENELKWFHTTKKAKVGAKHIDLLKADSRRRQADFLRKNPTFHLKNSTKLTEKTNEALSSLAKNSLYFKSNTLLHSNRRSMTSSKSPEDGADYEDFQMRSEIAMMG